MSNLRFSQNQVNGKISLGGPAISGTPGIYSPNNTAVGALFDEVLKSENIAGTPDYRCLYFQNDSTQTVYEPKIKLISLTPTASFALGRVSDRNVIAQAIGDENVAPNSITFSEFQSQDISLIQGTNNFLLPGQFVAFWLRRTPTNLGSSGTVSADMTFQISYRN